MTDRHDGLASASASRRSPGSRPRIGAEVLGTPEIDHLGAALQIGAIQQMIRPHRRHVRGSAQ